MKLCNIGAAKPLQHQTKLNSRHQDSLNQQRRMFVLYRLARTAEEAFVPTRSRDTTCPSASMPSCCFFIPNIFRLLLDFQRISIG